MSSKKAKKTLTANKLFYSIDDICAELGICKMTVTRMIRRGDLPDFDIGQGNNGKKAWHKTTIDRHFQRSRKSAKPVRQAV